MKTTIIVDFDTCSVWTLVESEYKFDFDATQDALNIMKELRLKVCADAGIGWHRLYRAALKLEAECEQYMRGK